MIIEHNYTETNVHSRLVWFLTIILLILIVALVVALYIYIGLKKKQELINVQSRKSLKDKSKKGEKNSDKKEEITGAEKFS